MRVSLRARQTAAVTLLIALAMTALSVQHLANLARVGLEDSRGIGVLVGRMIYQRAREAIAAGGDPEAALRTDQGIRSILESTAVYGNNVTYAAVVDNDSRAIAHSFPCRRRPEDRTRGKPRRRARRQHARSRFAPSTPTARSRWRCRSSSATRRSARFA